MSLIAFLGALETGFVFGLVALGVYLSFRILHFPDLTVDGSFPLGAAISASLIITGVDPYAATFIAMLGGCGAGLVTAWLNVRLNILHLLASILTMIALYSINLRIMGRPNIALLGEETVFSPVTDLGLPTYMLVPAVMAAVAIAAKILLDLFLVSEVGLAMRAAGANPRMARSQGIDTGRYILLGMAMSNGLVALAGALFAQSQGSADVTMGVGVIVVGLAAVIGGEAIITPRTVVRATLAAVVGSVLYRIVVALALNADVLGLQAQDLNLITAVLVAAAMVLPGVRRPVARLLTRRALNGRQPR